MQYHRHRTLNRKWLFLLSLFAFLRFLTLLVGIAFFALGAFQYHIPYLMISGGCLSLLLLLQMVQAIEGSKVVCPSCRSHVMKSNRVAKTKQAKKLFGSYSLRVAFQVLFTKFFTCQYCNLRYQWRGALKSDDE